METNLDELTELGLAVDADPAHVARRAGELVAAVRDHDPLQACRAATLRARALRNLRDVESAERAIDDALDLGQSVGHDVLADAHLVAASITTFRRSADRTAHHLDEAERHGSEEIRTQVLIQRAVLLQRDGHIDEALDLFDLVIDPLRMRGEVVTLARVVSNRAIILVLRGEAEAALRDFGEAQLLFQEAGQPFAASIIWQNMAWAKLNLGDTCGALQLLDRAKEELPDVHEIELSRAETLMAAGLFETAVSTLTDVLERIEIDGDRAAVAEASLLLAEAARVSGRPDEVSARAAVQIFDGLGQNGRADHARLELLRITDDATSLDEAEALAMRLADSGHLRSAVEAWGVATNLALSACDIDRARRSADRCREAAKPVPFVEHRLASAHADASVEAACGDRVAALDLVTSALDEFAEYRRTIGSPDARNSSGRHAAALVALGDRIVAASGCALSVLTWSERRRTSVPIWVRPHAPASDVADPMLAELRSVLAELRDTEAGASPSGRTAPHLFARRALLEANLRDRMLRLQDDGSDHRADAVMTAVDPDHLSSASPDGTIISLDLLDDILFAVIITEEGSVLVELGDAVPVLQTAAAAAKLVTACARAGRSIRDGSNTWTRLDAAVARLDDLVLVPLDLPDGRVTIVAPPTLHIAPWTMTSTLRNRPVAFASSLDEATDTTLSISDVMNRPLRSIAAIAGPRLVNAVREVAVVSAVYSGGRALTGESACGAALADALATVDIVHLSAHTRLRHDNPMWSTIELADGPITLHELTQQPVLSSLIVLSSCESAVAAGDVDAALPGFAAALRTMGAESVVATIGELPDDETTVACVAHFHRRLVNGGGPAKALADLRRCQPDALASYAFVCWGRP